MSRFLAFGCILAGVAFVAPSWAQDAKIPIAEAKPTAAPTARPDSVDNKSALRPMIVRIQLSNSQELRGTLQQTTTLQMKTAFGQISVPLNEVVAIKMAQEGNSTTTVALHNGDSVTGAIEMETIMLETEWGKAEVNAPHVNSIMFSEGLKWISETGTNGPRWKLTPVSDKPATPVATTATPTAQRPNVVPFNQPFNRPR